MMSTFFNARAINRVRILGLICLFTLLASLPAAHAADALNGGRLFNNGPGAGDVQACASCHGDSSMIKLNINNIQRGADNPTRITNAINGGVKDMAIFIGQLSATEIADIAAFIANPAAASPSASVSPSNLSFGAGGSGASQNVTVSNAGSTGLGISSISISGTAAADYSVAGGTCVAGGTLAANASCTVSIAFKPAASGARPALLAIVSSASTLQVGLNGAGSLSYQGLWWNPNESGWGISLTQHGNIVFAALYTYEPSGAPVWYVMSNCPLSGVSCTGDIYQVSGGTAPTVAWNGAAKVVGSAGTGTLTFADADNATLNIILNGVAVTRPISRQVFAGGSGAPAVDYTDLWWNANESGWGIALTQQFGTIFAAWYTYDANGRPIWYVASNCQLAGDGCSGDVYQVTAGTPLTSAWNGANKITSKVGTLSIAFSDANNGVVSYSIHGVAGTRTLTRQDF